MCQPSENVKNVKKKLLPVHPGWPDSDRSEVSGYRTLTVKKCIHTHFRGLIIYNIVYICITQVQLLVRMFYNDDKWEILERLTFDRSKTGNMENFDTGAGLLRSGDIKILWQKWWARRAEVNTTDIIQLFIIINLESQSAFQNERSKSTSS